MKAVKVLGDSKTPQITLTTHEKPTAQNDALLVRVHAAGLTADEVNWPELYESSSRVPGHDVSGVVVELGPEYKGDLKVGDEVFAMIHAGGEGGQAEYAVVAAGEAARKPKNLSHEQVAALPIPVLTAFEMVQKAGDAVSPGGTVLITGASGAVGRALVQIAKGKVVALASEKHHEELKKLGAHTCLDYNADWQSEVKNVDVAFDTAGGEMLDKCWPSVKSDGTIVTVGDPIPPWAFGQGEAKEAKTYPDVKYVFFIVTASGEVLTKVGALVDDGKVKPLPIEVFNADDAVNAWKHAGTRGRKGKVVIKFI